MKVIYCIQSKEGSVRNINEGQGKELFESNLFETAIERVVVLHKDTVYKVTIRKIIYVDRIMRRF